MDKSSTAQSAFAGILSTEIEQAQSLLDLLEREYQLLRSSPSKDLEAIQTEKKRLLKMVEASTVAHHRFLQQQGLTADRQGTESYLREGCGQNPQLVRNWEHYVILLEASRKQNEINGGAVALNQRQVSQALNILLGINDGNKTYGKSGESRPTNPSKSLGKA